jgi:hypothetical protein
MHWYLCVVVIMFVLSCVQVEALRRADPPFQDSYRMCIKQKRKKNSVAFSAQANCTDWGTAAGRRILVITFALRGVSRGQSGSSPRPLISVFLDRSPYLFFQVAPHLSLRGWVETVQDPLVFRKTGRDGNQTRDLSFVARNSGHWLINWKNGQGPTKGL